MELTPNLKKALDKWSKQKTKKANDILRGNKIQNRTGKLYGSLKQSPGITTGSSGELQIKLKLPYYAVYVDGFGGKKWMTKKGRLSKIPTNFLRPFREMGDLLKELKDQTVEYIIGTIREDTKDIKDINNK